MYNNANLMQQRKTFNNTSRGALLYEKAHAPLEIKHSYFDGIAEPSALSVAFSLVAVLLALLSYWASTAPDSQPQ
jgi:hypothetical protein